MSAAKSLTICCPVCNATLLIPLNITIGRRFRRSVEFKLTPDTSPIPAHVGRHMGSDDDPPVEYE